MVGLAALALALGAAPAARAAQSAAAIAGTVSVVGPDGQPFNVPGVNVALRPGSPDLSVLSEFSNEVGEYRFSEVPPGSYVLEASLQGFATLTRPVTVRAEDALTLDLRLELAQVHETVIVVADDDRHIDVQDVAPAPELKQQTLQTVPLAKEQYQDALPLVPGVVRGPDGLINVKGARASQSGLMVNSASVTDPVTGEFAINLPIEAIESVQMLTNPYAAEFGKFTGGVTSIATRSGTNRFSFQIQNVMPRFRRRGGKFAGIEGATPRVAFGGPLVKDKVSFMQSLQYRFTRSEVESLPPFERDTELESFDSFTQLDWNMSPSSHLGTSFSVFPQKLRFVGLNTFNPQRVTPNFRQRGFFWAVNERQVISDRALLESFFSIKQFDADVFPSTDGPAMMLAPDVNTGSFFNRQNRDSRRVEALETFTFTPRAWGGAHVMKVGGGVSFNTFDGLHQSHTVQILRADGTRSQQIDFAGAGVLSRDKTEVQGFFQDKWTVSPRLTLEYGVRYDRDTVADRNNVAPRAAVAFLPAADGRTVIRGGVGLFYDKINLNLTTFEQLQDRVLTDFAPDGLLAIAGPRRQRLVLDGGRFRTPRSVNWNVELEREWMKDLLVRVSYQQRNGYREYVIDPIDDSPAGGRLLLASRGRSRYREFQVTGRYRLKSADQLVVSYVRSAVRGDLNDFNSFFGNFQNPVIRPNERARLPWDAPNRLLVWGEFSLKYRLSVAPVFEIRNGFPLSTIDEDRNFVGPRNGAGRFPTFTSFDLQVLKSVRLPFAGKKRAKIGVRTFNLLNHFNPRDFQGNLASGAAGRFFNGVSRSIRGKFVIDF